MPTEEGPESICLHHNSPRMQDKENFCSQQCLHVTWPGAVGVYLQEEGATARNGPMTEHDLWGLRFPPWAHPSA